MSARVATTVTGDFVRVRQLPGGATATSVVPAGSTAAARSVQVMRVGRDVYAFPATVTPYLGRGLDPSLFNVTSQDQVLTLDARKATSLASVVTPRPAERSMAVFDWERDDAGKSGGLNLSLGAGAEQLWVTPQKAPAFGTLTSSTTFGLVSPPSSASKYRYDLSYGLYTGVPAAQKYTVRASELETTVNTFSGSGEPDQTGALARMVSRPGDKHRFGFAPSQAMPRTETDYLRAGAGAFVLDTWISKAYPMAPAPEYLDAQPEYVVAGRTRSGNWALPPAMPQVPTVTDASAAYAHGADCVACRHASALQVFLNPGEDTAPGHSYELVGSSTGPAVSRLQVLSGGRTLADVANKFQARVTVPAAKAKYRVVYDVDRTQSAAARSTTSHTELTFHSSSAGPRLPSNQRCFLGTDCTVLPLLRADVALPMNNVGAVPVGTSTITLSLSHIAGAAKTAITSGTVEVRIGDGTWTKLPVTRLGGGRYAAKLTTTAAQAGKKVDLRVSGTDAAGGSLSQAVTAAFIVRSV